MTRYPDDEAEAAGVAAEIAALIAQGVPAAGDRHPGADERAPGAVRARARRGKVPYVVRGAERFYERPEVRKALVLLRGAARAAGAGTDATGLDGGELPAAVRHVLAVAGLTAAPPAARGAVREALGVARRHRRARRRPAAARPAATLADFAAELAAARRDRARAGRGGGEPGHDARRQGA